jgi:hypothetical protein
VREVFGAAEAEALRPGVTRAYAALLGQGARGAVAALA